MLGSCFGSIFIFGHSADPNNANIYSAIFRSEVEHLFFCVYQPIEEKLKEISVELARYKARSGSKLDVSLVDSESSRSGIEHRRNRYVPLLACRPRLFRLWRPLGLARHIPLGAALNKGLTVGTGHVGVEHQPGTVSCTNSEGAFRLTEMCFQRDLKAVQAV